MVDHFKQENEKLKARIAALEEENNKFESRLAALEAQLKAGATPKAAAAPAPAPAAAAPAAAEEDDDVDLFGDDDEEDEAEKEKIKQARVAEYNAKKANKAKVIAKSQIILDVKPWDDETPLDKLEECVRSVECEGLLWGTSKFVEVGYGIKKLQITCVVEDDKCGTDFLEEHITAFEDYVQSMDVVAFNKL